MERPISVLNIDYVFIYHCFLFFARHLTKTKKAVLRVWSDKKKSWKLYYSFHGREAKYFSRCSHFCQPQIRIRNEKILPKGNPSHTLTSSCHSRIEEQPKGQNLTALHLVPPFSHHYWKMSPYFVPYFDGVQRLGFLLETRCFQSQTSHCYWLSKRPADYCSIQYEAS